jgi:hypothetical protein
MNGTNEENPSNFLFSLYPSILFIFSISFITSVTFKIVPTYGFNPWIMADWYW